MIAREIIIRELLYIELLTEFRFNGEFISTNIQLLRSCCYLYLRSRGAIYL